MADAKHTTVGELTGTRRRYSKIAVPDRLARFIGADELVIEHIDEGISANEIPFWFAYYEIKKKENRK